MESLESRLHSSAPEKLKTYSFFKDILCIATMHPVIVTYAFMLLSLIPAVCSGILTIFNFQQFSSEPFSFLAIF